TLVNNNLIGTFLMCQAFIPAMKERGRGAVVNIASAAAHVGVSPEVIYSTLKAAVVHYTRCMAAELRPFGVRINAVRPGGTKTARSVAPRAAGGEGGGAAPAVDRWAGRAGSAGGGAFVEGKRARFVRGQTPGVEGAPPLSGGGGPGAALDGRAPPAA